MKKLTKEEFLALSTLIKNNLDLEAYCMLGMHAFGVDLEVVENTEQDNNTTEEVPSIVEPHSTAVNAVLKANSITRDGIDYIEIHIAAKLLRTNVPCMFRNNKSLNDAKTHFYVNRQAQTFIPTNKLREIIIVDDFSELCTIKEICEKTDLTYFMVRSIVEKNKLPYLFSKRSRLYNMTTVCKLRDRLERWSLQHGGIGGCNVIHNL